VRIVKGLTPALSAAVLGALFSVPVVSTGQTTATQPAASTAPANLKTPQQHLDEAKRILAGVNESSLTGEASRLFATLKRDVNDLAASYLKRKDWRKGYSAAEADLLALVGSGSNTPSGSSTATTAPPSGGVANLDALVRGHLLEVRTQLGLFYAATMREQERTSPR
jgi:hypothetical protein